MAVRLFYVLLVGCTVCGSAEGQSWRKFSPPNKRLIIGELPKSPKTLTRKDEQLPTIFPRTTTVNFYSVDVIPGGEHELFFGVINLSKRVNNQRFDETVDSNMLWIGGDDKHFSKQADRTVAGLHGREFVFSKGDTSGRALFLNSRGRVYVVVYFTEGETVPTETLDRIFNSFRPLRAN